MLNINIIQAKNEKIADWLGNIYFFTEAGPLVRRGSSQEKEIWRSEAVHLRLYIGDTHII